MVVMIIVFYRVPAQSRALPGPCFAIPEHVEVVESGWERCGVSDGHRPSCSTPSRLNSIHLSPSRFGFPPHFSQRLGVLYAVASHWTMISTRRPMVGSRPPSSNTSLT